MKLILILFSLLLLSACQTPTKITRTYHAEYETQIGYAQVVEFDGKVYISGVVGEGPDMKNAVNQVYKNISGILKKHGLTFTDVIQENLFTTDMAAMRKEIATRKGYYPNGKYPASSWVEVKGLFMPEFILEVELVVRRP